MMDVIAGIDWCIRKREEYQIRIMNISVGALNEQPDKKERLLVEWVEKRGTPG